MLALGSNPPGNMEPMSTVPLSQSQSDPCQLPPIIFAGSASQHLGNAICKQLNMHCGHTEIRRFSDGEMRVKVNENVRGAKCFVVQSTCTPVHDNLMELLLTID